MHLIAPLAAGVAGAENGTAEIYERGTALRATYWVDFEATFGIVSGQDVALDAHGGAVTYVNELCTVLVKTAGGATLRTFVAGDAASCVEVKSPSFTGTDYTTAASGPGEETTLSEVLDRWKIVNGGIDWQVLVPNPGGGTSSVGIGQAIAGSYGLVFNVKAFGALGDGVAFDTVAINSAISAAAATGGGVVYFPPGTYRTAGGHSTNVSLVGAGNNATAIVLDNLAGSFVLATAPPVVGLGSQSVTDMRFGAAAPTGGACIVSLPLGSRVVFSNLVLDGTNFGRSIMEAVSGSTESICVGCLFQLSGSGSAWNHPGGASIKRAQFRECRFVVPASYSASAIINERGALYIDACLFDNSAAVTGNYSCVDCPESSHIHWHVCSSEFTNAAGATVTALNLRTYSNQAQVYEAGNHFNAVKAYSYGFDASTRGAQVSLLSRELRSIFITDNSVTPVLPIDQYGLVVFSNNSALPVVFQAANIPPDGARGTIICYRPAGSASPVNVTAGPNFLGGANASASATGAYLWEYRACIPGSTPRMALTVDGRNLGTGA